MTATRRLAAILAAAVAGYSRLIGVDEGGTLQAPKAIRAELIDPTIASHNGRLVKTTGDGFLVEFGSVVDALHCSTAVQAEMPAHRGTEGSNPFRSSGESDTSTCWYRADVLDVVERGVIDRPLFRSLHRRGQP